MDLMQRIDQILSRNKTQISLVHKKDSADIRHEIRSAIIAISHYYKEKDQDFLISYIDEIMKISDDKLEVTLQCFKHLIKQTEKIVIYA